VTAPIGRLAIVGVGLIGGSLGLVARSRGLAGEVVGCGRGRANLDAALDLGLVDRASTDVTEAVRGADVVVLAVPAASCAPLAAEIARYASPDAVLTDVASVKLPVVTALEAAWPDPGRVVGAHPIAGSHRTGARAASATLFDGARCILTPTAATAPAALARIEALWRGTGALTERMDPARHDDILAWVSHAPHAVAYALAEAVGRAEAGDALLAYAGSGFLDTTRIARGSPTLWRDVLLANATATSTALAASRAVLADLEHALATGDAESLERLLTAARARLPRNDEP
jgi:prephenate dehydrogenase